MAKNPMNSFELAGKEFKVVYEDFIGDEDELGIAYCDEGLIKISLSFKGRKLKKDFIEQTVFHEITHCIFHEIGRDDLCSDESLVQQVSLLIHQVMKSWKK